ncbi:MAG: hypothetical protein AMXMBFR58_26980 [Phycisphaerae bacterium]|nr:hypothetical protein [Phycisphaerales bacterium]MCK6475363.1 hypothetical protein [Phycisphaerales bacterium]
MNRSNPAEVLRDSVDARRKAEDLLRGLLEAKSQTESFLAEGGREDPVKSLTGRSAIDNAINSTKRMIDTLDRAIEQVRRELDQDDWVEIGDAVEAR